MEPATWVDFLPASDDSDIQGTVNFLRDNPAIAQLLSKAIMGIYLFSNWNDRLSVPYDPNGSYQSAFQAEVLKRWNKEVREDNSHLNWSLPETLAQYGGSIEQLRGFIDVLNSAFNLRPKILAWLCTHHRDANKRLRANTERRKEEYWNQKLRERQAQNDHL